MKNRFPVPCQSKIWRHGRPYLPCVSDETQAVLKRRRESDTGCAAKHPGSSCIFLKPNSYEQTIAACREMDSRPKTRKALKAAEKLQAAREKAQIRQEKRMRREVAPQGQGARRRFMEDELRRLSPYKDLRRPSWEADYKHWRDMPCESLVAEEFRDAKDAILDHLRIDCKRNGYNCVIVDERRKLTMEDWIRWGKKGYIALRMLGYQPPSHEEFEDWVIERGVRSGHVLRIVHDGDKPLSRAESHGVEWEKLYLHYVRTYKGVRGPCATHAKEIRAAVRRRVNTYHIPWPKVDFLRDVSIPALDVVYGRHRLCRVNFLSLWEPMYDAVPKVKREPVKERRKGIMTTREETYEEYQQRVAREAGLLEREMKRRWRIAQSQMLLGISQYNEDRIRDVWSSNVVSALTSATTRGNVICYWKLTQEEDPNGQMVEKHSYRTFQQVQEVSHWDRHRWKLNYNFTDFLQLVDHIRALLHEMLLAGRQACGRRARDVELAWLTQAAYERMMRVLFMVDLDRRVGRSQYDRSIRQSGRVYDDEYVEGIVPQGCVLPQGANNSLMRFTLVDRVEGNVVPTGVANNVDTEPLAQALVQRSDSSWMSLADLIIQVNELIAMMVTSDNTKSYIIGVVAILHKVASHFGLIGIFAQILSGVLPSLEQEGRAAGIDMESFRQVMDQYIVNPLWDYWNPVAGWRGIDDVPDRIVRDYVRDFNVGFNKGFRFVTRRQPAAEPQALSYSDLTRKFFFDQVLSRIFSSLLAYAKQQHEMASERDTWEAVAARDQDLGLVCAANVRIAELGGNAWALASPENSAVALYVQQLAHVCKGRYTVLNSAPLIHRKLADMVSLAETHASGCINVSSSRTPALAVYVFGPPGQGKTEAVQAMCTEISRRMNWRSIPYTPCLSDEFWEGYCGQDIVLMPEMFATNSVEISRREADVIMRACESQPWPLRMATCESKGRVKFTSRLVVATSNMDVANLRDNGSTVGLRESSALLRRLRVVLRARCALTSVLTDGVIDPAKVAIECERLREIGHRHAPPPGVDRLPPNMMYEYDIINALTGAVEHHDLSFSDACQLIKQKLDQLHETQTVADYGFNPNDLHTFVNEGFSGLSESGAPRCDQGRWNQLMLVGTILLSAFGVWRAVQNARSTVDAIVPKVWVPGRNEPRQQRESEEQCTCGLAKCAECRERAVASESCDCGLAKCDECVRRVRESRQEDAVSPGIGFWDQRAESRDVEHVHRVAVVPVRRPEHVQEKRPESGDFVRRAEHMERRAESGGFDRCVERIEQCPECGHVEHRAERLEKRPESRDFEQVQRVAVVPVRRAEHVQEKPQLSDVDDGQCAESRDFEHVHRMKVTPIRRAEGMVPLQRPVANEDEVERVSARPERYINRVAARTRQKCEELNEYLTSSEFPLDPVVNAESQMELVSVAPRGDVFGWFSQPFVKQGCDDPQALDQIGAFIVNQIFVARFEADGMRHCSQAFNLASRFYLVPYHTWRMVPREFTLYLSGARKHVIHSSLIKVARELPERELVVLDLHPSAVPEGKNLIPKLVTEQHVSFVGSQCIAVCRLLNNDHTCCFFGSSRLDRVESEVVDKVNESTQFKLLKAYQYPMMQTFAGMCAAPVVALDRSLPGKIVGFHCAGNANIRGGYCSVIYQSDFDFLLPRVRPVVSFAPQSATTVRAATLGQVELVGTVPNCMRQVQAGKSSIHPSIIYGMFSTPTRDIAVLKENEKGLDPLTLGQLKNMSTAHTIPLEDYKELKTFMVNSLRVLLSRRGIAAPKVLELWSAFNGTLENHEDRLVVKTSPGFPFNTMRAGNKTAWLQLDEDNQIVGVDDELMDRIQTMESLIEQGITPAVVFRDTLKDEKRPIAKVEECKTRVFSAAPVDFVVVFRRYFLSASAKLMQVCVDGPCAVGLDPHGVDWANLLRTMNRIDGKFLAGDFSSFDGHLTSAFGWLAFEVLNELYDDECSAQRMALAAAVMNAAHISDCFVYRMPHGVPSGLPITSLLNSLANWGIHLHCWMKKSGYSLAQFPKMVDAHFYGDDSLLKVAHEALPTYNMNVLAAHCKELGMRYTPASKDEQLVPHIPLEEVTFLKRRFVSSDGVVLAPLPLDLIRDIPNWVRGSTVIEQEESLRSGFQSFCQEMSHYPQDVYEEQTTCLAKILSMAGVLVVPSTWEKLRRRYESI